MAEAGEGRRGDERAGEEEAGGDRARKPEDYWRRKRSLGQRRAMLTKAIAHLVRRRILRQLADEGAPLSPVQLSRALSMPLATIIYHSAVLRTCGALEPAGERQVRGAVEHFYETTISNDRPIEALLEETREGDEEDI